MTWKRLGTISAIIAALLVLPITRRLVLFLLPLGRGVDDIIVWIAVVIALIVWGGQWASDILEDSRRLLKEMEYNARTRAIFFMIVGTILLLAVVAGWIVLSSLLVQQ